MANDLSQALTVNHRHVLAVVELVEYVRPRWLALLDDPKEGKASCAQRDLWSEQVRLARLRVTATSTKALADLYAAAGERIETPLRELIKPERGFVVGEPPRLVFRSAHELITRLCEDAEPEQLQVREMKDTGHGIIGTIEEAPRAAGLRARAQAFLNAYAQAGVSDLRQRLEREFAGATRDAGGNATELLRAASPDEEAVQSARRLLELIGRAAIHGDARRADKPGRQRVAQLGVEETVLPKQHEIEQALLACRFASARGVGLTCLLAQDLLHVLNTQEREYREVGRQCDNGDDGDWWQFAIGDWKDKNNLDVLKARDELGQALRPPPDGKEQQLVDPPVLAKEPIRAAGPGSPVTEDATEAATREPVDDWVSVPYAAEKTGISRDAIDGWRTRKRNPISSEVKAGVINVRLSEVQDELRRKQREGRIQGDENSTPDD